MRYLILTLFLAAPVLGQSWEYSGPIRGPVTPPPSAKWTAATTIDGRPVWIAEWDEWDSSPVAVAARPVARRPPELVLPMRAANTWTVPVYSAPSYAVPPRVARAVERTAVPVRYAGPVYYGGPVCTTGNCR